VKSGDRVILLAGGDSPERDVSLASAKSILEALEAAGREVVLIDPLHPGMSREDVRSEVVHAGIDASPPSPGAGAHRSDFVRALMEAASDGAIVFNALHGGAGEDGTIQAIMEFIGVPFTGSGAQASMLAMDKRISRRIAEAAGVPVPEGFSVESAGADADEVHASIQDGPGYPVVVKPARQGSSVGLSIVSSRKDLEAAISKAAAFDRDVIVESYIEGSEITVSILGEKALPIIEVRPRSGLYDYKHKYTSGVTEYVVPAPLDAGLEEAFSRYALEAFRALGCEVYGRADFRLSRDGEPYFLEVNTLPGMTAHSLVPKSAQAAGIDFLELIERIVELSLRTSRTSH